MTQEKTKAAAKLQHWANVGERGPAVAFVGREQEIELAISQLATWRPGLTPGRTVVAQGAPGAGKTALLNEIGRRLPERLPNAVSIYLPTPWNQRSAPNVLQTLAARMMGTTGDEFCTTKGTQGSIGVRAIAAARLGRSQSTAPPDLSSWSDLETLFADQVGRARPTLLLVDEVQRMGDDQETVDLLYHLHDQTTFPVVLVCGGLSTSAAHLRGLGLSRLADGNVLAIDALSLVDAQECLEESLRMMAEDAGIEGHPDGWALRLAGATYGWPQHATCHIRGAAGAFQASGRLVFDDDNMAHAAALAAAAMRDYYEQRLEASRTDTSIVFAVHEVARRAPTDAAAAADVVDKVAATLSGNRRKLYEVFPDALHCLHQMLHSGVIAYSGNTATSPLSIPIPSMADYVARQLPREQRNDVRRLLG